MDLPAPVFTGHYGQAISHLDFELFDDCKIADIEFYKCHGDEYSKRFTLYGALLSATPA